MKTPTCCNHNCRQSDDCPFRQPRDLTRGEIVVWAIAAVLWAMVTVAAITGARP